MPAPELVTFSGVRRENEMKVGGIDVAVGQNGVAGQNGEAGENGRLAGAALAGNDNEFLHAPTLSRMAVNRARYSGSASINASPRE